jgi:hypothetical protein
LLPASNLFPTCNLNSIKVARLKIREIHFLSLNVQCT